MFKDLSLESRTYIHKIVRLSSAQFGLVMNSSLFCSLIAVSLLKIILISDNLSIKFAIVAMNIDNSSMTIAFSYFFIADFLCELNRCTIAYKKIKI